MTNNIDDKKQRTANNTYKKLAVQWLNEHLCFVSSSVVADSFRLRNRQLLVAAKRKQGHTIGPGGQTQLGKYALGTPSSNIFKSCRFICKQIPLPNKCGNNAGAI